MATAIYHKQDALKKHNNSKVLDIKLFAEDIDTTGKKKFYVTKPKVIYDGIIDPKSTKSHMYEFWSETSKILFSLDLDIKGKSRDESINIVKANIKKVCLAMKKYYNFTMNINDVVVLESEPTISIKESNKYSYHIVFRGIYFQNHMVVKDFFIKANNDYDIEFGDASIYNMTCFRLCYCCKAGKTATLLPLELVINSKRTLTDTNSPLNDYQFFLRTMMTYILPSETKEIKKTDMFVKIKYEPQYESDKLKTDVENLNLEHMLFELPIHMCDDYKIWINIGLLLANLDTENSQPYFELWNKWSAQSDKYKEYAMKRTWNGLLNSKTPINIGYLINLCKGAGVTNMFKNVKVNFTETIKSYPKKEIKLDRNDNTIILDMPKLEPKVFLPHINKKLLCLQSEKGTGKTSNLFRAMFENDVVNENTKMLFVSSRRTFGVKLLGDLEQYGFKLYSDIAATEIHADKLICQIDSLGRVATDMFDYVIIDECESVARYITSSHFVKNPKANLIVSSLEQRIVESKRVVIMDADLSNRCMEYYKDIMSTNEDDFKLIINTFKAFKEYSMVSMVYEDWIQKILEDIASDKKVVIPMASNNKAKDLRTKIEVDFPNKRVLLIHKETQDAEKVKNLLNVNETWQDYDIVIYTPSVCMGVSFDIPDYFDAIYGYGCENSLGSQEFCQMLHRVREPKNKTIYIALNAYKDYDDVEDIMKFEDVEQLLCSDHYLTHYELHNNLIPVKVGRNQTNDDGRSEKILYYPYKNDPVYRLFVHNALESIENKLNFAASFYGYVKEKEYNIEFYACANKDNNLKAMMKDIRKSREGAEVEISVQGILDAPDITKDDFIDLLKQRDEYLEPEDIQKINRYKFRNCYKLETDIELTYEMVEEFNTRDKMKWYYNLVNILPTEEQNISDKLEIMKDNIIADKWLTSCYMDFTSKSTYTNHLYATNLIANSGFDMDNLDQTVSHDVLKETMKNCINYLDSNKQEIAYKFNMKIYNKNFDNLEMKEQLRIVNTVINGFYGVKIKRITPYKKNVDESKIIYKLSDSKTWDSLPKEVKIEPINLEKAQEVTYEKHDESSFLKYMEHGFDDEDDE